MDEPNRVMRAEQQHVAFIDDLQKKNAHALGFFPLHWIRKAIIESHCWVGIENGQPSCYLIGKATYRDRLDVGVIYQACVCYDLHRRNVGHALVDSYLQDMPETCRAVILWCAQDLPANLFWTAMGFSAIAYRAGSRTKQRVHILWQAPVKLETRLAEPYIPEMTSGGAMRANRKVHRIEPGHNWNDVISYDAALDEMRVEAPGAIAEPLIQLPSVKLRRPPKVRPVQVPMDPREAQLIFHARHSHRTILVAGNARHLPQIL